MHMLVAGPARAKNVTLAFKIQKKNLEVFEMQTCFSDGPQMLLTHKSKNWDTASIYFIVLVNKVALFVGMSFLYLCVRFYVNVLLYCIVTETFAVGFENWSDHQRIILGVFCCNMPRFIIFKSAWTKTCKKCSIFSCDSFLTTIILFDG